MEHGAIDRRDVDDSEGLAEFERERTKSPTHCQAEQQRRPQQQLERESRREMSAADLVVQQVHLEDALLGMLAGDGLASQLILRIAVAHRAA